MNILFCIVLFRFKQEDEVLPNVFYLTGKNSYAQ